MAVIVPDFIVYLVRYSPPRLFLSKRESCNAMRTKQLRSNIQVEQVKEKRERRHNAMKQFLLKECCLSSSQITTVISRDPALFRRKSTDRAQQALQLFRDSGFTIDEVRKTIIRNPSVLAHTVDEQLKPKIDFLKTFGIAEEDVGYLISHQPRILCNSLDKNLTPKILLLLNLFGSKTNLAKALRRAPGIVVCDFEIVKEKIKIMESLGLLDHEIKEVLKKDPRFLCSSIGKIQKNMDFLTHTVGFKPNVVVKYPQFLNFSVERRMRPRYKVFEYLNALQPSKYLTVSLVTMLSISEQAFTQMFLSSRLEVTMLYEKYKAKRVDVEIT